MQVDTKVADDKESGEITAVGQRQCCTMINNTKDELGGEEAVEMQGEAPDKQSKSTDSKESDRTSPDVMPVILQEMLHADHKNDSKQIISSSVTPHKEKMGVVDVEIIEIPDSDSDDEVNVTSTDRTQMTSHAQMLVADVAQSRHSIPKLQSSVINYGGDVYHDIYKSSGSGTAQVRSDRTYSEHNSTTGLDRIKVSNIVSLSPNKPSRYGTCDIFPSSASSRLPSPKQHGVAASKYSADIRHHPYEHHRHTSARKSFQQLQTARKSFSYQQVQPAFIPMTATEVMPSVTQSHTERTHEMHMKNSHSRNHSQSSSAVSSISTANPIASMEQMNSRLGRYSLGTHMQARQVPMSLPSRRGMLVSSSQCHPFSNHALTTSTYMPHQNVPSQYRNEKLAKITRNRRHYTDSCNGAQAIPISSDPEVIEID